MKNEKTKELSRENLTEKKDLVAYGLVHLLQNALEKTIMFFFNFSLITEHNKALRSLYDEVITFVDYLSGWVQTLSKYFKKT